LTRSINKDKKKVYEFERVKDSMEFERIADKWDEDCKFEKKFRPQCILSLLIFNAKEKSLTFVLWD